MPVVLDMGHEKEISKILDEMTLAEKVGQLNQPPLIYNKDELKELIRKGRAGSVVLAYTPLAGSEEREAAVELRRELQRIAENESRLGIPLLLGRDVIHGHHTVFPIPLAQAAAWDEELVKIAAKISAGEARKEEINWTFAPMMDISRDPRWGRVIEGFGEDPLLASRIAAAMVSGFQGGNSASSLAACAKHFIGYGAVEGGRDYHTTEISDYSLRNIYLPPFEAAIKAGVATVMASFNDISGEAVTGSRRLLTGLLKEELGFKGFVVSDWNAVAQLIEQGVAENRREAALLAFNAGVDMDMASGCYNEHLEELVLEDSVSMERLDDAVRRVLRVKFACGLMKNGKKGEEKQSRRERPAMDHAIAFAQASMLLLKNKENILPLKDKDLSVALIGPMADDTRSLLGSWTLDWREEYSISLRKGLMNTAPFVNLLSAEWDSENDIQEAAVGADLIIAAVGEDWNSTGEARGSAAVELPREQCRLMERLAATGLPVVAVIYGGRPLVLSKIEEYASAILYAWHGGAGTGEAAARILFGKSSPGGKAPISFLRFAGQAPLYYNHRQNARNAGEYYDSPAEYRPYLDKKGSPLYPFGFGLSYTSFKYSEPVLTKTAGGEGLLKLSVEIENTGKYEGTEIAQCYVHGEKSRYVRPVRALVDWKKIRLKPGEKAIAEFEINANMLSIKSSEGEKIFMPGKYTLWVGESSQTGNSISFNYPG